MVSENAFSLCWLLSFESGVQVFQPGDIWNWTLRFSRFFWELNKKTLTRHRVFSVRVPVKMFCCSRSTLHECPNRSTRIISFGKTGFARKSAFQIPKKSWDYGSPSPSSAARGDQSHILQSDLFISTYMILFLGIHIYNDFTFPLVLSRLCLHFALFSLSFTFCRYLTVPVDSIHNILFIQISKWMVLLREVNF